MAKLSHLGLLLTEIVGRQLLLFKASSPKMYDDATYYTFVPSAQSHEEYSQRGKQRTKQSLLKQPNVSLQPCFA